MTILSVTAPASPVAVSERWRVQSFARLPDWSGRWTLESPEEVSHRLRARPPYQPEWEARFMALLQQPPDGSPGGDDALRTWGVPMLMLQSPHMFEALMTPEETALIFCGREIRHAYTDGRRHLPADQLLPARWGDSIGFWDGNTLVIDTVAVASPRIFIWHNGGGELLAVLSERVHFVERLRMVGDDLLEDEMTIHDPAALARPWTLTHQYRRVTHRDRTMHKGREVNERDPVRSLPPLHHGLPEAYQQSAGAVAS